MCQKQKYIIETETEIVFKGVGWQFEKILEQILFLLVFVSNSYEVLKTECEHPGVIHLTAHNLDEIISRIVLYQNIVPGS